MWNAECGMRNVECRMLNVEIEDSTKSMQNEELWN